MLVTSYLDLKNPGTMPEHLVKELEEAKNKPIVYDEDCPPLSVERMREHVIGILKKKETEIVVG